MEEPDAGRPLPAQDLGLALHPPGDGLARFSCSIRDDFRTAIARRPRAAKMMPAPPLR